MTEGSGEDFADALLPLLEILDDDDQLELSQETLEFIAKVFALRNTPSKAKTVSQALKPIVKHKEKI